MSSEQDGKYAIEVSNLGKSYQMYDQPSDRLKQMLMGGRKQYYKEFWALKGVGFQIKKGETVGIIGRNGSGKSTLLQMICGTLNPTEGEVKVNGRVAALLELGAGFNPEFTGVENVYMAASLYGLSRQEVDQRFEAIATFADIGEHIHQPVKTYSSGMYVRLAFAVIAHVDADILVVDEALAVGDAVFTQKCMRFIRKFKENGTLLFVSHDMGSVLNLCERAVWLHSGQVRQMGEAKSISEAYLQYTLQEVYGNEAQLQAIEKPEGNVWHDQAQHSDDALSSEHQKSQPTDGPALLDYQAQAQVHQNLHEANGWKSGAGEIVTVNMTVIGQNMTGNDVLKGGETIRMSITALAHEDMARPILGFLVRDKLGQDLFGENTLPFTNLQPQPVTAGEQIQADFTFKMPMLPNGDYTVMTSLADGDLYNHVQHHWLHNALIMHVVSSKVRYGLVGVQFSEMQLFKK
jgi:lipopolysaccharide transport system ATP-binding protein